MLIRNTFISLLLVLSCIFWNIFLSQTYAAQGSITVEVMEKVPGANCSGPNSDGVYSCQVGKGFSPIQKMIGEIVKYFTFIALIGAVLFIVINGILYSMAGIDQSLKEGAKKRIGKMLIWLVLLLLSGVILNAIAPWVYTF